MTALARATGVSETWLLTGRGSPDTADAVAPADVAPEPPRAPARVETSISRLEQAVGEAFENGRHVASAVAAVLHVITDTDQRQRSDVDLLEAARTWLDAATDIIRGGDSVTVERLLDRVTFGKTPRARDVGAELAARANAEARDAAEEHGLIQQVSNPTRSSRG